MNMGKVYKNKKGSGCKMCKPHKHGWAPKKKVKDLSEEEEARKIIKKLKGRTEGLLDDDELEIQ